MKKQKMIILLLFVTVLCSAVFLGCNTGRIIVPEDYEAEGLQKVTMYYNGGTESSNLSVDYFIPNGGRMPYPSSSQDSYLSVPTRSGYELYTWLQVDKDMFDTRDELMYNTFIKDNGDTTQEPILNTDNKHASRKVPFIIGYDFTNPDKNEQALTYKHFEDEQAEDFEGQRIFLREWNFDFDKVTEDICLVAIWRPMRYYVILPFENINDNIDEVGYNKQRLRNIDATGAIIKPATSQLPTKAGSQVEGLYLDINCTIAVPFDKENKFYPPVEMLPGGDRYKVVPLYAKWLDAKYKIISAATDLVSDFDRDTNLYVTNHLDFAGVTIKFPSVYSGEIQGNGFVWKNLTMRIKQENPRFQGPDNYGAIFNELSGAQISRIHFENLEIVFERLNPSKEQVNWSRPVTIHVFAREDLIDARTEIRDVTLGSASDPVRCTMVEATEFGMLLRVPELKNGYPQRYSLLHGWVSADDNGNYPELEYSLDYLGNYEELLTGLKDDDSKTLYGYNVFTSPTNLATPPEVPTFVEEIFGNSKYPKVTGCSIEMQSSISAFDWQVEYESGMLAPESLGTIVAGGNTHVFAGWYIEVDRTVKDDTDRTPVPYKAFEKYDFTQAPTGTVTLTALWKLA